jgi:hypothetical protein
VLTDPAIYGFVALVVSVPAHDVQLLLLPEVGDVCIVVVAAIGFGGGGCNDDTDIGG